MPRPAFPSSSRRVFVDSGAYLALLDQILQGMTEDETDAFWLTHSLGDDLFEQMEPFPEDFPVPPRAARRTGDHL